MCETLSLLSTVDEIGGSLCCIMQPNIKVFRRNSFDEVYQMIGSKFLGQWVPGERIKYWGTNTFLNNLTSCFLNIQFCYLSTWNQTTTVIGASRHKFSPEMFFSKTTNCMYITGWMNEPPSRQWVCKVLNILLVCCKRISWNDVDLLVKCNSRFRSCSTPVSAPKCHTIHHYFRT